DPMERKLLYERGKAAIEGAQGLQKEAIGAAFKAEEQEREMATKRMDARTKELRGEGGVLAEARQYAEKAAAAEGVIRLIDQISTQEDIPGVGSYFGAHELSPGARDTDAQVRALVEALGRMQSGAVISAEEEKR